MTRLYFVRHGQSESNLITQFAGSLNMPLTEKGRSQAQATAAFLTEIPFTAAYASNLDRAYETGLIVARPHDLEVVPTARLREIFAGDWEGKTYNELELLYPESYTTWKTRIGMAHCDNGESVAQLQQRIRSCVEEIVHRHPNETVCIATHATPIRVMECIWTNTPLEQMHTIPWTCNASVTVAEYDEEGRGRLVARDLHDHLGDLYTVLAKNV